MRRLRRRETKEAVRPGDARFETLQLYSDDWRLRWDETTMLTEVGRRFMHEGREYEIIEVYSTLVQVPGRVAVAAPVELLSSPLTRALTQPHMRALAFDCIAETVDPEARARHEQPAFLWDWIADSDMFPPTSDRVFAPAKGTEFEYESGLGDIFYTQAEVDACAKWKDRLYTLYEKLGTSVGISAYMAHPGWPAVEAAAREALEEMQRNTPALKPRPPRATG